MQKFVTILLIIVLLISQVGYYFIYTFRQYQIKEEVKKQMLAGLPDSSLEIIVADQNDIIWEEEEKEFSLNGEMYDVAKIKKVNGRILIYCLNDEKEQELLHNLAKAASGSANNKQKGSKHVVKLALNAFIPDMLEAFVLMWPNKEQRYPDFVSAICTSLKTVLSPPPRLRNL